MFQWQFTLYCPHKIPTLFSYASLFGGFDLCDVAWPDASRLLSCDSLNHNDVLPERQLSKDEYQVCHQVNRNKALKKNTPDVLVVQRPL
jgi:hypothetical protein